MNSQELIIPRRVCMGKSFKLSMDEHSLLRIDGDRRGTIISCVKGAVCVTQQNDIKDHILSDDESFLINRKGRVIAWAVSATTIEIVFPETDRHCMMGQLMRLIAI
jgi:hypothetical protein